MWSGKHLGLEGSIKWDKVWEVLLHGPAWSRDGKWRLRLADTNIHNECHHYSQHCPAWGCLKDKEKFKLGSEPEKTGEHLRTQNSGEGEVGETLSQGKGVFFRRQLPAQSQMARPDQEGRERREVGWGGGVHEKKTSEGMQPCQHLGFHRGKPVSDF